jgi:hypothetical protein
MTPVGTLRSIWGASVSLRLRVYFCSILALGKVL